MHAWLCVTLDGADALQWRELPMPEPAPGEVRIAIAAASLNFPDLLIVRGQYQFKPPLPFVPGAEFAGVVDAVGTDVRHLRIGQNVAAIGGTGGFATHACVDARRVLPLPDGFPAVDAAAFVFTYGTSHHALIDRARLQPGETVLVLGAAGGVGSAAVQIAKAAGARVVAAASGADKCRWLADIGADATVDTSSPDTLRDAVKAATGGRGPDVVYDPVGGALAEPALRGIAWRGRYLVVGFAAGPIPALPWNLALLKGASIVGVFWGEFVQREPREFAASLGELLAWHADGRVKPLVDATLPMAELKAAYAQMAGRRVRGKVVLVNS